MEAHGILVALIGLSGAIGSALIMRPRALVAAAARIRQARVTRAQGSGIKAWPRVFRPAPANALTSGPPEDGPHDRGACSTQS